VQRLQNFDDVHAALRRFYGKHADGPYTLDRMRELMEAVGDPQEKVRVVHIAGTSGKTSTAYFVSALLQQTGAKVGLTVSPHVDEVNERVQINGQPLSEKEFCKAFSEFLKLIEDSGITPSYFECMVAFAYWEFARQKVDYAVVEVGLGGLLDGTNVVSRADKLCIITDIGLDHTELLGDTVEKIAAQKAGIIQSGNDVFMHKQAPEIMEVVKATCKSMKAGLNIAHGATLPKSIDLPSFQQRNFILAKDAVEWLLQKKLTDKQLKSASQVYIPARMEIVEHDRHKVIIDGAHNAQKLATLFDSIHEKFPGEPIAVLAGFTEGDPFRLQQALEVVTKHASSMIVTSFYSEKDYPKHSVPVEQVVIQAHKLGFENVEAIQRPEDALHALLSRPEHVVVVTGSFYLLNHVRPELVEVHA
jgi:dihydrofolate synthase/folylpolyglutamate synthase